MVVDVFWLVVGDGGWWWVYYDWWWLIVGGGGTWGIYFGWWWVMVDGGGWWHSLAIPATLIYLGILLEVIQKVCQHFLTPFHLCNLLKNDKIWHGTEKCLLSIYGFLSISHIKGCRNHIISRDVQVKKLPP